MTLPPPPPGAMPPPSQGGPYPPQPGGHGPYDPGFPGGQPQWQPQPAPRRRGSGWKWALGGVALVAVIGVTAAVTLSVAGNGNGNGASAGATQPSGDSTSDIASANDTGPVTVITEDPTCAAQDPILRTMGDKRRNAGWNERDASKPASEWTPAVRAQFEQAGTAMRAAANQLAPLAKLTPHRVMRELYEQFIVYARAYADSFPTYTAPDENLTLTANSITSVISHICGAIENGSAAARAPLISPNEPPSQVAPVGNPANPQRFLEEPNPVCSDWNAANDQYGRDIAEWDKTDPAIPASQWTPELQALNDSVVPVMDRFATRQQELGERSGNPVLRDFADLLDQYRRAYIAAIPTYVPADNYLAKISSRTAALVGVACRAAER